MKNMVQNRIRDLRESKGFSQTAMAKELGVSRTAFINFEHGKFKEYSKVTKAFGEYFGISEAEILYGKEVFEDEINYREQFYALKERYSKMVIEKDEEIAILKSRLRQAEDIMRALSTSYNSLMEQTKE